MDNYNTNYNRCYRTIINSGMLLPTRSIYISINDRTINNSMKSFTPFIPQQIAVTFFFLLKKLHAVLLTVFYIFCEKYSLSQKTHSLSSCYQETKKCKVLGHRRFCNENLKHADSRDSFLKCKKQLLIENRNIRMITCL